MSREGCLAWELEHHESMTILHSSDRGGEEMKGSGHSGAVSPTKP